MHTPAEILARVRSKLTWALEHGITPTLDQDEMKAVLAELKKEPAPAPVPLKIVEAPKKVVKGG